MTLQILSQILSVLFALYETEEAAISKNVKNKDLTPFPTFPYFENCYPFFTFQRYVLVRDRLLVHPAWPAVRGSWSVAITIEIEVPAGRTAAATFRSHAIAHPFTPRLGDDIICARQPGHDRRGVDCPDVSVTSDDPPAALAQKYLAEVAHHRPAVCVAGSIAIEQPYERILVHGVCQIPERLELFDTIIVIVACGYEEISRILELPLQVLLRFILGRFQLYLQSLDFLLGILVGPHESLALASHGIDIYIGRL